MAARHDLTKHLTGLALPPAGAARHPACLPVYVLFSSSPLLRQEALGSLRDALLGGPAAAGVAERFVASEAGAVEAALTAARSLPLWAPRRGAPTLVVLHGTGSFSAGDAERLGAYLRQPADHSVLCLVVERLDGRTKLGRALQAGGGLFELLPPRPAELPGWLRGRARQRHLDLEEAAARLLVDYLGSDLDLLLGALEQVALYVGEPRPIDAAAVTEVLTRSRQESIFAFTDALGRRDFAGAMQRLENLLHDGQSPLMVLTMLVRQLRQLVQIKAFGPRASKGDVAARLKVQPFVVDRLLAQAGAFAEGELLGALTAASRADLLLKSSRLAAPLVLAQVVEAICR